MELAAETERWSPRPSSAHIARSSMAGSAEAEYFARAARAAASDVAASE
jgi:hypothetical protein